MKAAIDIVARAWQEQNLRRLVYSTVSFAVAVSVVFTAFAVSKPADAYTYPGTGYPQCTNAKDPSNNVTLNSDSTNAKVSISGKNAVAEFKFPGSCKNMNIPITLVSYKAPSADAKPYSKQQLYKSVTRNYNVPRSDAKITVAIPDCFFQVDLVIGAPITQFSDPPDYSSTYHGQQRFLAATGGGNKSCDAPAVTPTPAAAPTPTPTPPVVKTECAPGSVWKDKNGNGQIESGECLVPVKPAVQQTTVVINENINVNNVTVNTPAPAPVAKTVAATPAPPVVKANTKELPNTGPGDLMAIFVAVSSLGSGFYNLLRVRNPFGV